MSSRIDHIALRTPDFDGTIALLERSCGLRLLRIGVVAATGQRIAMIGDGTGMKLELIDAADALGLSFAHIAFCVDDVDAAYQAMIAAEWASKKPPRDLPPAQARTALVSDAARSLDVQLISYDPASPDVKEWDIAENVMGKPRS
jgi:4-hydroxyphenylpyruvate dioxygenase-like putative hemolysin